MGLLQTISSKLCPQNKEALPSLIAPVHYYLLGEPILDVYYKGSYSTIPESNNPTRFIVNQSHVFPGGSWNIINSFHEVNSYNIVSAVDKRFTDWPKLIRIQDTNEPIEIVVKSNYSLTLEQMLYNLIDSFSNSKPKALIVSNYNKGLLNKPLSSLSKKILQKLGPFDFMVVDDKHGTLHTDYLELSNFKILHATGNEINRHDLRKYNLTYHTDGQNRVEVYIENRLNESFPVPEVTQVQNTSGAGDYFTASLARSFGEQTGKADFSSVSSIYAFAAEEAIRHCQEFVSKPLI